MKNIWTSADFHFGHFNILRHCSRPFSNTNEMDIAIVRNWNKLVQPNDDAYILGDVAMNFTGYTLNLLFQLNGKLHLIAGNHDSTRNKRMMEQSGRFEWIKDYYELKIQDEEAKNNKSQLMVLSHYPVLSWRNAHHGSWMIHGHCHGSLNHLNSGVCRLDVGVDNWNYSPVSYQKIKEHMKNQGFKKIDHHEAKKE